MMMHKTLLPGSIYTWLYESSKKEERQLASTEDCVDTTIQDLRDYLKKIYERLITETST